MKPIWLVNVCLAVVLIHSAQSASVKARRDESSVLEKEDVKDTARPSLDDRLKIEEASDGADKDQLKVVNKIKELLNNKIHESTTVDEITINVSELLPGPEQPTDFAKPVETSEAATEAATDVPIDENTIPVLKGSNLVLTTTEPGTTIPETTTSTTTTTTTTTTESTTQYVPPIVEEQTQAPPPPPAGLLSRISEFISSLNPFSGFGGLSPVVIGRNLIIG